jgi:hypothetical protein
MKILSRQQIESEAPAIFAASPAVHTSPDYHFVNTGEVLEMMAQHGWGVYDAKQTKVRNPEDASTTKHMFSLRRINDEPQALQLGGLIPTLIGINSHDWSSRLEFHFGMLRLVCANGLIVSGAMFDCFSVRHDRIADDISAILSRFASGASRMLEMANRWAEIQLTQAQAIEFAIKAAFLRFGPEFAGDAAKLLWQRRFEDKGADLWSIYNVIQENMLQGGFKVNRRRARQVGNIAAIRNLNTGLFQIAETYAQPQIDG